MVVEKHKEGLKISGISRILLIISVLLLFVLFGVSGYIYHLLGMIKTANLPKSDEELGIRRDAVVDSDNKDDSMGGKQNEKPRKVINIALFGLDTRDLNQRGRSDSIMILSIDTFNDKIKLSSIMRDSYVSIHGRGMDKVTHAYAYGGPLLAVRTLNENFDLDIRDYATVNFFSLEKIIDKLGGVPINVKQNEIFYINAHMKEVADIQKTDYVEVTKAGLQTLNGKQAVAYARIRYTGNGDYERTDRQRRVLSALFDKINKAGVTKYPSLVATLLPHVETSLSKKDILNLGTEVLTSGIKTVEQERFPVNGYCSGKIINGGWFLVFDQDATKEQIRKFIYDDVKPVPKY
jgi:polyisoprenyl-teichoic acid--peptidoglycan teichoic acid transferase